MVAISKPLSNYTNDSAVSTWNTFPPFFPWTSLCFLWLPSFFHSQAGGSDWISHEELSLHFSQTPASAFLFSLQFSSLGLRLWHCQSVGVIPQKAGKVRCRDEERLLSHISQCITWNAGRVWVAEAATHTHTHTQRYDFQFCRGSCLWALVTHVLGHALLPWTFWSFLTGSWAFLH